MNDQTVYDTIILGSGPAGFTAAIYAHRFGLSVLLLAGHKWGGQLMQTTDVENYPGFGAIQGPELMAKMRQHVESFNVEIVEKNAIKLRTSKRPFVVETEDNTTYQAKSVIVATGADTRWLDVPGEDKLKGRGVSACAPCDAFFFKGLAVSVVGGGDSAMEEAHVIARVASDTILIHRRDELRAQAAMIKKVEAENVHFIYNTEVKEMIGKNKLTHLLLETSEISPKQGVNSLDELVKKFNGEKKSDTQWLLPREGVFVAIGLIPNTAEFEGLERDKRGYIVRREETDDNGVTMYFTKTNVDGVFVAGDNHDARYKQAITAAGYGCMAAMDVQRWLKD